MTLFDRITELTDAVFVDQERFGEMVDFYPGADASKAQQIKCVIDEDALRGTNENPGDGVTMNRVAVKRERKSVSLEMPSTIALQWPQPKATPDVFRVRGELYAAKRLLQWDAGGMQLILCVREETAILRNYERTG